MNNDAKIARRAIAIAKALWVPGEPSHHFAHLGEGVEQACLENGIAPTPPSESFQRIYDLAFAATAAAEIERN